MQVIRWKWLKQFRKVWETPAPEPALQAARILHMQRNIVLPAKLVVILLILYYLFFSTWMNELATTRSGVVLETLKSFTIFYVVVNAVAAVILLAIRRFPLGLVQWLVFTLGLVDGLYLGALIVVTGGLESSLYWVFPGLIVVNALSIPLAAPQLVLNLLLSAFFMGAGLLNETLSEAEIVPPMLPPTQRAARLIYVAPQIESGSGETATEPFFLRLIILWMLTGCCYGIQVLWARQKLALEEATEFAARQSQLAAAGRLAAEIAHQIKNPLGIINNAAFSLQRALAGGKNDVAQQIQIIREEVERSDRILTQLMGYAQLAEGRVEKLNMVEELDRAIEEVFPLAAQYEVQVHREYAAYLPPLLMQRSHLSTVLVNVLQNAREALNGRGNVFVTAQLRRDYLVEVTIRDDGPGIPSERAGKIFEAYFTSKDKGTGLGLAIVKHNVELYGGTVRVESELGKGAQFVLLFPAKALIKLS